MKRTTAAAGTVLTALALAGGGAGVAMAFDHTSQPASTPAATVRPATASTPAAGVRYCDRDCDRGWIPQRTTRQVRVAGQQPVHHSEPARHSEPSLYGTPRHADCDYGHR
jgi:hypothetical protein